MTKLEQIFIKYPPTHNVSFQQLREILAALGAAGTVPQPQPQRQPQSQYQPGAQRF
jgi:hypothetical protein